MWEKLDPKFKKKWVKALRSGKFKQARHTLGNQDRGYCCLGVACSIAGVTDKQMAGKGMPYSLTKKLQKELLASGFPKTLLSNNSTINQLVELNDNGVTDSHGRERSKTFKGIATWIEKNL